jgi:hypothetical protein
MSPVLCSNNIHEQIYGLGLLGKVHVNQASVSSEMLVIRQLLVKFFHIKFKKYLHNGLALTLGRSQTDRQMWHRQKAIFIYSIKNA